VLAVEREELRRELRRELRQGGWQKEGWPSLSSPPLHPTFSLALFSLSLLSAAFSSRFLSASCHQLGDSKQLKQREGQKREITAEEREAGDGSV